MRAARAEVGGRALLPAVVALLLASCADEPLRRPSVLLISIDTLRADHLSCYGYERATSPTLDRLAAEGVLFERTYSTTSWTLPSHMSLFTGLEISAHGVCDDRLWTALDAGELPLRGALLAERLREVGYATAGFHTAPYLDARFGFDAGFDTYERIGHSVYTHPVHSKRFQELRASGDAEALREWMEREPELFDDHRPTADEAVDAALAWLGAQGEADTFCFLHLFDVHNDYVPPPPFDTRFDPDYEGPIDGRRVAAKDSPVRPDMDPRDLEHLIALYDGEIAWVDSQLERLFARLRELGRFDDTLVVVTSDHGEEFFEHGHKTHRAALFDESLHVPLILRWPAGLPRGLRVSESTGLVDVAPTLTRLLGLDEIPTSGIDLGPLVAGEPAAERRVVSELLLFEPNARAPIRKLSLLEGARHTLVERRPGEDARAVRYDLAQDPHEAGTPEGVALETLPLDDVRDSVRRLRGAARERGEDASALTEEQFAEITAAGYAGHGSDLSAEESERLCLDGCVWPDE